MQQHLESKERSRTHGNQHRSPMPNELFAWLLGRTARLANSLTYLLRESEPMYATGKGMEGTEKLSHMRARVKTVSCCSPNCSQHFPQRPWMASSTGNDSIAGLKVRIVIV
jgi:hypothetical protein